MADDLNLFKGTFPYASELMGVYQPLLGWKSNQSRNMVTTEIAQAVDDIYQNILIEGNFRGSQKEIGLNIDANVNSSKSQLDRKATIGKQNGDF
jgi:hypothetical protein